jgi:penicillin-binding protein 2
VVVEHGGGSGAAYPIARDVMTYLFDQTKAMAVLADYESQWGGNLQQRMDAKYVTYAAKYGATAPAAPEDEAANSQANQDNRDDEPATPDTDAASPAPEPDVVPSPVPTPSPAATPTAPAPAATVAPPQ